MLASLDQLSTTRCPHHKLGLRGPPMLHHLVLLVPHWVITLLRARLRRCWTDLTWTPNPHLCRLFCVPARQPLHPPRRLSPPTRTPRPRLSSRKKMTLALPLLVIEPSTTVLPRLRLPSHPKKKKTQIAALTLPKRFLYPRIVLYLLGATLEISILIPHNKIVSATTVLLAVPLTAIFGVMALTNCHYVVLRGDRCSPEGRHGLHPQYMYLPLT